MVIAGRNIYQGSYCSCCDRHFSCRETPREPTRTTPYGAVFREETEKVHRDENGWKPSWNPNFRPDVRLASRVHYVTCDNCNARHRNPPQVYLSVSLAIARSVLAIARSVLAIARSVLAIARSVLAIARSVLAIARSVLAIARSVLAIARSGFGHSSVMLAIARSVLAIARSVLAIARSVLAIARYTEEKPNNVLVYGALLRLMGDMFHHRHSPHHR
ncbi:hypothetical protein NP493_261g02028 [Ridgeia piscesae]|uniref:Uncharacterized protein n=1 Tax=Ridgeia piscesae TaxID=27915 RepID=A0AAD9NY14_RIDPI|nr:hypothetical protein NP493_261g02028 [Ridgeia piscesae]